VLEAPRSVRLARLADELRETPAETLAAVSRETGLAIADPAGFDLEELGNLPVRLVHEFCCVPLKSDGTGPLRLATAWPPEGRMDDWIYTACDREPVWLLASGDELTKFITQHLGVGSESLDDPDGPQEFAAAIEEQRSKIAAIHAASPKPAR